MLILAQMHDGKFITTILRQLFLNYKCIYLFIELPSLCLSLLPIVSTNTVHV